MNVNMLISIPEDLKQELKHQSVNEKRPMSEIICELIAEYLEKNK